MDTGPVLGICGVVGEAAVPFSGRWRRGLDIPQGGLGLKCSPRSGQGVGFELVFVWGYFEPFLGKRWV